MTFRKGRSGNLGGRRKMTELRPVFRGRRGPTGANWAEMRAFQRAAGAWR